MEKNIDSQHLEYFKIENFKCFDSLELKDIGKFNLLLGDNNVGKSSVLESLLFNSHPFKCMSNLFAVFFHRTNGVKIAPDKVDYLNFFINSKSSEKILRYTFQYKGEVNKEHIKLALLESKDVGKKQLDSIIKNTFADVTQIPKNIISFRSNNDEEFLITDYNSYRLKDDSTYFPFVKSGFVYHDDLVDYYSRNIVNNIALKEEFINSLNILSDDIHDIAIDTTTIPNNPILIVIFKNDQKPVPLFMMGDGLIRLVRLILEIIMSRDGRLMIDEIDNGIHYSRMRSIWKMLLKIANKNNTQLFITTHDSECLKAFKEVLEEKDMLYLQNDVKSYTLIKNKDNQIESVKYNFQEFEHAINYSLNVRGGTL
jgi:AAA15 family ATPase/GTPase